MWYSHASRCWTTFAFAKANIFNLYMISIAALDPDAGLQKRATIPTLIVGRG
jgi:hypothetical protein